MMKNSILCLALLLLSQVAWAKPSMIPGPKAEIKDYQGYADAIVKLAHSNELGWQRLSSLCAQFPHRLSGSVALEQTIDWVVAEMKKDGFDSVTTEEVLVPHWVRGTGHLTVLAEKNRELAVLALGGSIATPAEGIEAEVLVVKGYEDLKNKAAQAKGKIVVIDVPFTSYGKTVGFRIDGASRAADAGAVACLLRSVTPFSLATPHTGVMYYDKASPKIPFAAISPDAAGHLYRRQKAGLSTRVKLVLGTQFFPDTTSRNVIAEIKGSEFPEQIVVMGGHIDGWDVGEGAHDDASGCVMSWEALRLISSYGLRPRRTIRVVLWTNEENGLRGGKAYRKQHDAEVKNHVLAIESDYGTFHPSGFSFGGTEAARAQLQRVTDLLTYSIGPMRVRTPGGGADIGPLMKQGVPGAGLTHNDHRYFWYHHTAADTLDKIDPKDFKNCTALLAVTSFVVASLPDRLPYGKAVR